MAKEAEPTGEGEEVAVSEERAQLRSQWELASVLQFFHLFRDHVKIDDEITAEDFESALINPDANSSLAMAYAALFKGIYKNKKEIDLLNFERPLMNLIQRRWDEISADPIYFECEKGQEKETYRNLSVAQRLEILQAVCHIRLDEEDIKSAIDASMNIRDVRNGVVKPMTAYRDEALGQDTEKSIYWYEEDIVFGIRLYKEFKPKYPRNKSHPVSGKWELLASSRAELEAFANKLRDTGKEKNNDLSEIVLEELIPVWNDLDKKRQREKRRRAALKQVSFAEEFGESIRRSRRERKQIKYDTADFDAAIDEAVKSEETREKKPNTSYRNTVYSRSYQPIDTYENEDVTGNGDLQNSRRNRVRTRYYEIDSDPDDYRDGDDAELGVDNGKQEEQDDDYRLSELDDEGNEDGEDSIDDDFSGDDGDDEDELVQYRTKSNLRSTSRHENNSDGVSTKRLTISLRRRPRVDYSNLNDHDGDSDHEDEWNDRRKYEERAAPSASNDEGNAGEKENDGYPPSDNEDEWAQSERDNENSELADDIDDENEKDEPDYDDDDKEPNNQHRNRLDQIANRRLDDDDDD